MDDQLIIQVSYTQRYCLLFSAYTTLVSTR